MISGLAAKVRPALLLTGNPADDDLDVVTVLLHTTSLRGNQWELNIPKPFLKPGAFHLQQIQTVSTVKLERRTGALDEAEMQRVRDVAGSAARNLAFPARTEEIQEAIRNSFVPGGTGDVCEPSTQPSMAGLFSRVPFVAADPSSAAAHGFHHYSLLGPAQNIGDSPSIKNEAAKTEFETS